MKVKKFVNPYADVWKRQIIAKDPLLKPETYIQNASKQSKKSKFTLEEIDENIKIFGEKTKIGELLKQIKVGSLELKR